MGRDLARLHQVFHAFRTALRLVVNFGRLECLERMRREGGGAPVADVALFTVTAKKMRQEPGYVEGQAALARRARTEQAGLEVVPMVAVWAGDGVPLPNPGWVGGAVEALRGAGAFSGLLFYPWTRPCWAEQAIKDVFPEFFRELRPQAGAHQVVGHLLALLSPSLPLEAAFVAAAGLLALSSR